MRVPTPLASYCCTWSAEHCGWICNLFSFGGGCFDISNTQYFCFRFSRFHLWTHGKDALFSEEHIGPGGPHLNFPVSTSSWAGLYTGHSLCCWKKMCNYQRKCHQHDVQSDAKWGIVIKSNKHSQIRLPLCFLKSQIPFQGTDLSQHFPSQPSICLWLNSAFPCQLKMIN